MPPFRNPLSDPRYGLVRAGKPEKMKFDFITRFPAPREQTDVGAAAECAFQSEGFPLAQRLGDFVKQQASGLQRCCLGIERREAAGDFISIEKPKAMNFVRKKLACEYCFASAIGTGDQIDRGRRRGHCFAYAFA